MVRSKKDEKPLSCTLLYFKLKALAELTSMPQLTHQAIS